jgi:arginine decarboxylase-like protein
MLIDKLIRGDTVRQVLEYTGYSAEEMRESLAKQLAKRKSLGAIGDDDEHEVLATCARILDDYTYLE